MIREIKCPDDRAEILAEVNAERDYQNKRWGTEFDDKNTANDWVTYIIRYAAKACDFDADIVGFRKHMVKVAALAVAAVETLDRNCGYLPPRHYDEVAHETHSG